MQSYQTKSIDMENVHNVVDESRHPPWSGFLDDFGNLQEHKNSRKFGEYSTLLRSWQRNILKKFWMWNAWNIHHRHGRDQYWPMIKRSSGQRQQYVSTLIPFCVSDRWKIFQEQYKDGKAQLEISGCIRLIEMQRESTEKRLKVSQDSHQNLFFARSSTTCRKRTSSQRTPRTGSSSCQGSLTLYGKWMVRIAFRMPKNQELRDEILARTLDVSGSRVGRKMVWRFSRSKSTVD